MDNTTLKEIAKTVFQQARDMKEEGKIPLVLGPNGMLALVHYKTTEHTGNPTREDILQIAVYALCAYALTHDEDEWAELLDESDPDTEDEIPAEKVANTEPPWEEALEDEEECPHDSTTNINGWVHCASCGEPLYEQKPSTDPVT